MMNRICNFLDILIANGHCASEEMPISVSIMSTHVLCVGYCDALKPSGGSASASCDAKNRVTAAANNFIIPVCDPHLSVRQCRAG